VKPASRLPQWPPPRWTLARWFTLRRITRTALTLVTAGVLTALIFIHLDFYQVGSSLEQFRAGQPVPVDVIAPRSLHWTQHDETELRRDEAERAVATVYAPNPSALFDARADLETIFARLSLPTLTGSAQADLSRLRVTEETIKAARALDPATREALRAVTLAITERVMAKSIHPGTEEADAATRLARLAAAQVSDATHARIARELARAVLRPTLVEDVKKTAALRLAARTGISPVVRDLQRGDPVLRRGEIVTVDDLRQLKDNGLVTPAPARLLPIALLMLFAVVSLGGYVRVYARAVFDSDRRMILLALLLIAPAWASLVLGREHEYLVGLLSVPAASMAIAGLLGGPVSIVATVVLSIAVALPADHAFFVLLLALGSGLAGVMAVDYIWPASRTLPAVGALAAINLVLLASVQGISPGGGLTWEWTQLGGMALTAVGGGAGAAVVAVGTIYLLARPFRITTHYRLMELSNPNEPLLRRMMLEAPGSYHSSVMVANMAEAVADALGLDVLLTRVAALYHDIGKLKRPTFFVENQGPLGADNVHDSLAPTLSYQVLAGHVRDGVELAKEHHLPEEVVQIISEHHGTTLAAYFYHRAVTAAEGTPPAESDFRYPGPRPSTREAAVVMLADSVQASVKSLKEPTMKRIEVMVADIISSRLQDGQFEDCALTLRDLRSVSDVLTRMLTGLYSYTRLEYPEVKGEAGRIYAGIDSEPPSSASTEDAVETGR
jgi:cyclic-di-AMP phosphodiesterase PgpH